MKTIDSEKALLKEKLKKAVRGCQEIMVGSRKLSSSFKLTPKDFLDFTDDKYVDGSHSYKMSASVEIKNKDGDSIEEEGCDIHFDARIDGTDIEIINRLIIVDRNIIPINWEI